MSSEPAATLRLRLDTQALAANWRALDEMSGEARAGAAVKADCYGLGVDQCVPVLRDAGCAHFFVAHWGEVAAVAQHVSASTIAVLHGIQSAADAAYANAIGAVPVINSVRQAQLWLAGGGKACHLMIDTGINRLGLPMTDLAEPVIARLEVDILMSHLACADEDSLRNVAQLASFREATGQVPHRLASLANSAGIALGADYHFDQTRPGLSLYGGVPRAELDGVIQPVATPQAAIMQTRKVSAGEGLGYNARFVADRDMRIGVVSLGYADGVLRSWSGPGFMLHGENRCAMLGTISMDMIIVDLSAAPEAVEGDWLTLPYSLPHAAQQTTLSQYELLTVLGTRFDRLTH